MTKKQRAHALAERILSQLGDDPAALQLVLALIRELARRPRRR